MQKKGKENVLAVDCVKRPPLKKCQERPTKRCYLHRSLTIEQLCECKKRRKIEVTMIRGTSPLEKHPINGEAKKSNWEGTQTDFARQSKASCNIEIVTLGLR